MHLISVLIVDDNDSFRSEVVEYLGMQPGVKVIGEATNASEAIRLAQSLHPDLILMDMDMPVINGLESAKRLKQQGITSKVVILTLHQDETYDELAKSPHVDSVIAKSSVWRDIQKTIRRTRVELDGK